MKIFTQLALGFVVILSGSCYAESVLVNDGIIPFLYEVRADTPVPDNELAGFISPDYRLEKDELSRQDLFQELEPEVRKRLLDAEQTSSISLNIRGRLGDYNFEEMSFATGFVASSYIPFGNNYSVVFINSEDIELLPMPLISARRLAAPLSRSRKVLYKLHGEVVGIDEKLLRWKKNKIVLVKITKMEAVLMSGSRVGEKDI